MSDYIFFARNITGTSFGHEADSTVHYLTVTDGDASISPSHEGDISSSCTSEGA